MAQGTRQQRQTGQTRSAGRTRKASSGLVPSRKQYLDLKAQYPKGILLYRMGDFYEAFDDDARIVARDARITLTSRNFGRNGRVPMAGIPHHALNHYLGRLLAAGHTIAIAEQLSEPGKGLVERGVTRVLTPGTVGEPALLPASENRYLAAICPMGERIGLAWVDVSTGEFAVTEFAGAQAEAQLDEELARLNPAECLVPDDGRADGVMVGHRTRFEHWHFEPERARSGLTRQFGTRSLAPFGCDALPAAIGAAGAIVAYLSRTNPALLPLLTRLRTETLDRRVGLDTATRRNLELTRSLRTGGTRGSLLGILDQTRTAMGARTLRRLIGQPIRDLPELQRRQGIVAALVARRTVRAALGAILSGVGDLERRVSRVSQGQATTRDFVTLAAALRSVPAVTAALHETSDAALAAFAEEMDACSDVLALLDSAVEEDDEAGARFRWGFCASLDAVREMARQTRRWLVELERRERERTGIRSLKVGFNKVFGYYIEVTRPNLHLVPPEYSRKQTISTGERYVTAELKEAEVRLLAADDEIAALERQALARPGADVVQATDRLLALAGQLAFLDALLALAEVADQNGWTRPELDEGDTLAIEGGRHPVVEASLSGDPFIANDCRLGGEHPRMLLVTGPNMGGKSTYLRQVAVIVLLAQVGSFVPARAARIGLVDRIFSRVGAQDDLSGGSSTFMVEMIETATILHQATRKSLVILDEVGRGTSTYDGMAIARAVLEEIHDRIGARTLFATHYLELTALAERLPMVASVHLAALEQDNRVIFLYAVRPGPADRAYGIHVARLAGLPPWVADRAETYLAEAEQAGPPLRSVEPSQPIPAGDGVQEDGAPYQLAFDGFAPARRAADRLAHELAAIDLTTVTPREALDWLFAQQARLRGGS